MTNEEKICPDAEAYFPGENHIYHCNKPKSFIQKVLPFLAPLFDCRDKKYIEGIVDNHGKPLPLCGREMTRPSEQEICVNYEFSRRQGANEIARDEGTSGTIGYKNKGCYECDGHKKECVSYQLNKG